MSPEGQFTAFYQSHSTILYNTTCTGALRFLFTSNDGDELRREHRLNALNTGTKQKYFSLANIFTWLTDLT